MALASFLAAIVLAGAGFAVGMTYGVRRGRSLQKEEDDKRDALEGASINDLMDQIAKRQIERLPS